MKIQTEEECNSYSAWVDPLFEGNEGSGGSAGDASNVSCFLRLDALWTRCEAVCLWQGRIPSSTGGAGSAQVQVHLHHVDSVSACPHKESGSRRALHNSPLTLDLLAGLIEATECSLGGQGLSVATAGVSASFRITARDSFGNIRGYGCQDYFAANMYESALRSPDVLESSTPRSIQAEVSKSQNTSTNGISTGSYDVGYLATVAGWWSVQVAVAGVSRLPTPLERVLVRPGAACAGMSSISGTGLTLASAGVQAVFRITLRDSYGNLAGRPSPGDAGVCDRLWFTMAPDVNETIPLPLQTTSSASAFLAPEEAFTIAYTSYHAGTWQTAFRLCGESLRDSAPQVLIIARGAASACSRAWGMGLTLRTAGVESAFWVSIRDCFDASPLPLLAVSAALGDEEQRGPANVVHVSDVGVGWGGGGASGGTTAGSFVHASHTRVLQQSGLAYGGVGEYVVSQLKTLSGVYSTSVQLLTRGGLLGRYYAGSAAVFDMSGEAMTRVDSTLDFDWGLFSPRIGLLPADGFAVHWQGHVSLPAGDLLTAKETLVTWHLQASPGDDARLLLDHRVIMTIGPSKPAGGRKSVSVAMRATRMYHIAIEYRHRLSVASLQLRWQGKGINNNSKIPSQIPSTNLWASSGHIMGSPWTTHVLSADVSPHACTASGVVHSGTGQSRALMPGICDAVLTAGGTAEFTLTARDSFGNLADFSRVVVLGSIEYLPAPSNAAGGEVMIMEQSAAESAAKQGDNTSNMTRNESQALTTSFASVGFAATYTRAGTAIINARVFDRVGLTATYYLGIPFWLSVLFCRARLPAHTLT